MQTDLQAKILAMAHRFHLLKTANVLRCDEGDPPKKKWNENQHEINTMKKLILTSIAFAGIAAFGQNAAAADNAQGYNGSYCSNYYGSQATSVNHQYNGIYNLSAGGLYVSCPVIVDEVSNTTGTNWAWVHYTGANTVSCSLFSMNGNGSIRQSQSASRAGTGWFQIPNLTTDDFWGSYSMYCYLPSGGTLNTVHISEKP